MNPYHFAIQSLFVDHASQYGENALLLAVLQVGDALEESTGENPYTFIPGHLRSLGVNENAVRLIEQKLHTEAEKHAKR